MNVENNKITHIKSTEAELAPDTVFHVALGWLTALSVTIAVVATAA